VGNQCDLYISEALRIADDLMELASNGEIHMEDIGCGILFGIVRDCAYKIRQQAELQLRAHKTSPIG
jgi:hypothetical protein